MCFFYLGDTAPLLALAFSFWEWNWQRWFFRLFCSLALAGTVLYATPAMLFGELILLDLRHAPAAANMHPLTRRYAALSAEIYDPVKEGYDA